MKKIATLPSNIIVSRIKENLKGILSLFDDNKYTNFESEITLPEELTHTLDSVDKKAKDYEKNGIIGSIMRTSQSKKQDFAPIKTPKVNSSKHQVPQTPKKDYDKELEL